jgi:flagellar basal-body rod modification protein FlgD
MAAAAGIFNHPMMAAQALTGLGATPMDSSTSGTSGTSISSDAGSDSATISANDFLTLLVTEMQNQDPTANTDPNEYINQLVNVNSLEQLISINQTLTTDLSTPSSSGSPSAQVAKAAPGVTGASSASATAAPLAAAQPTSATGLAPGNLSAPRANSAAQRVAHALDGRTRAQTARGSVTATQ